MSERFPTLKAKELVKFLQKDGFELSHQKGSHATYKHPVTQKRVTIPIHSGKDLKKGLLKGILNDLGLSSEEFLKKLRA